MLTVCLGEEKVVCASGFFMLVTNFASGEFFDTCAPLLAAAYRSDNIILKR